MNLHVVSDRVARIEGMVVASTAESVPMSGRSDDSPVTDSPDDPEPGPPDGWYQ